MLEAKKRLFGLVLQKDDLAELDPAERRLSLRRLLAHQVDPNELPDLVAALAADIDGFGAVAGLMADPRITDILVNGADEVWVERGGALERTDVAFSDEDELRAWAQRLMARSQGRVDMAHPIGGATLADGSRLHVVLPPVSTTPLVSIRRFPAHPLSLSDLLSSRFLTTEEADALRRHVRARRSIVVSGGTGTGKTTLLGALLGELPHGERVVLIEETRELRAAGSHLVSLVVREPNAERFGGIDQSILVRAALRMRPDRIVVGEVRGAEALDALAAMSTGHPGSMLSIHARSSGEVRDRLVTLALQARAGLGETAVRRMVDSAVDVVVHLERTEGGQRVLKTVDA